MGNPGHAIPADTVARLPLSPLANLTGLLAALVPARFNDEGFPVGCEWQRGSGMNAQWYTTGAAWEGCAR